MIPSYEEIMLPLLKLLSDSKEHSLQEADDKLSAHFNLSENERRELLPSGTQPVFRNRLYSTPHSSDQGLPFLNLIFNEISVCRYC